MHNNHHYRGAQVTAAFGRPALQALRRALGPTYRPAPLYARYMPAGRPAPVTQDEPGHPGQNLAFVWDPKTRTLTPVPYAQAQRQPGVWVLCVQAWWSGRTYSWTLSLLADGWAPVTAPPEDIVRGI